MQLRPWVKRIRFNVEKKEFNAILTYYNNVKFIYRYIYSTDLPKEFFDSIIDKLRVAPIMGVDLDLKANYYMFSGYSVEKQFEFVYLPGRDNVAHLFKRSRELKIFRKTLVVEGVNDKEPLKYAKSNKPPKPNVRIQ
jgi:hypothetical protein